MADEPKSMALEACDDALKERVSRISSNLMDALTSAKSDKAKQAAIDAARKGLELSRETHTTMIELVDKVF